MENLKNFFQQEMASRLECTKNDRGLYCGFQDIKNVKEHQEIYDIITYLSIDSRQRDVEKYNNPSYYNIELDKEYQFIKSIKLKSIEFHDPPTPINKRNNIFYWITDYSGLDPNIQTKVEYSFTMPKSYYTYTSFIKTFQEQINSIEHNINSLSIHNTFPAFTMYINNSTKKLEVIQRIEKLSITKISFTKGTNCIEIEVISSTQPFDETKEDVPIIITGLELYVSDTDIGNIPLHFIQYTPFFPKNSPLQNKTLKNKHNYYEFIGLSGINYIYKLHIFKPDKNPVTISNTGTIQNLDEIKEQYGMPTKCYVGRSLTFEVVTDEKRIIENRGYSNENTMSLGKFLGLQTENMDIYIHTNMDYAIEEVKNKILWKVIAFEEIALAVEDYIFMRIETLSQTANKISNNLVCAKGSFKNTLLVNDKENFFFAKILFSDRTPGDITIDFVGGNKYFYQENIDKMQDITIEFVDVYGERLDLDLHHSFTLEITEQRTVLEQTALNSKTGVSS